MIYLRLDTGPRIEYDGVVRVFAELPVEDADRAELAVTLGDEGPIFDVIEDGAVVATMGMMWSEFADYVVARAEALHGR